MSLTNPTPVPTPTPEELLQQSVNKVIEQNKKQSKRLEIIHWLTFFGSLFGLINLVILAGVVLK